MSYPLAQVTVGVVVERRASLSAWSQVLWRPLSVVVGSPSARPWTIIDTGPAATVFFAGEATIDLFRTETANYSANLAAQVPLLWVVLGESDTEPGMMLRAVTADPAEGEALTGSGTDLVETVPMPQSMIQTVKDFIAEHHVDRPAYRRQRSRYEPT